jgi:predicted lipoprotein with Yx(FWY)xxD motif
MFRSRRNTPTHAIRRIGMVAGGLTLAMALGTQAASIEAASAAKHPATLVSTTKSAMLGAYLETARGRTLYTFTLDTSTKSNCTGACAIEWPPLLVPKGVKLSEVVHGVTASKVGKIKRANGTFQLTYEGKPLYRFAGDKAADQTKGQGLDNVWFVALVSPAADVTSSPAPMVTAPTAPTAPPTSAGSNQTHDSSGSSAGSSQSPPTQPTPTQPTPTQPTPTQPTPTQPTPTQPTLPTQPTEPSTPTPPVAPSQPAPAPVSGY